jgi:hypothetical protein
MTAPLSSPDYDPTNEGLDPASPARQRFVKILTVLTIPVILIVFVLVVEQQRQRF